MMHDSDGDARAPALSPGGPRRAEGVQGRGTTFFVALQAA